MAPRNPRVVKAFHAMRDLGIPEEKVKPVLKKLLKLYDKNWDLIEGEHYRVLADAIFDDEEPQDPVSANKKENVEAPIIAKKKEYAEASSSQKKKRGISEQEQTLEREELPQDRTEQPLKRLCLKYPGSDAYKGSTSLAGGSLIIPKDEPVDDGPEYTPLAVMYPETSNEDGEKSPQKENSAEPLAIKQKETSQLHVASTPLGEVKIALSCDVSPSRIGFRMPSIEAVMKMVEDRCLRSYKIVDPNFSVKKVMEDMCECFLELGSESARKDKATVKESVQVFPGTDLSKNSSSGNPFLGRAVPLYPDDIYNAPSDTLVALPENLQLPSPNENIGPYKESSHCNGVVQADNNQNDLDATTGQSLVVVQQNELTLGQIRAVYNLSDISKGQERVVIPLERGEQEYLPSFHYIPQNTVFQNASVNFSLDRMGDNCCSTCIGDCIKSDLPCVCANGTGGEFAYTVEGLVKEEFLHEFISIKFHPQNHSQYFCKECPLERSKSGDAMEPCKGHLVRKFIKECWLKCGCNKKDCGNRIVQRGITCKLQVFASEGKGWGLRALEDLPKGAFVCEYVGEILTNAELFDRISRSPKGEGHSYPVLLDADWGSEGVLKDEEALCLDGTMYGNVARFINHRCSDANLVEIPVEIENPDHHYYHHAFFTTREVKAMEELTWDYGIDFDDVEHPVKAFKCLCGSKFCRNIRRPRRSRLLSRT